MRESKSIVYDALYDALVDMAANLKKKSRARAACNPDRCIHAQHNAKWCRCTKCKAVIAWCQIAEKRPSSIEHGADEFDCPHCGAAQVLLECGRITEPL